MIISLLSKYKKSAESLLELDKWVVLSLQKRLLTFKIIINRFNGINVQMNGFSVIQWRIEFDNQVLWKFKSNVKLMNYKYELLILIMMPKGEKEKKECWVARLNMYRYKLIVVFSPIENHVLCDWTDVHISNYNWLSMMYEEHFENTLVFCSLL